MEIQVKKEKSWYVENIEKVEDGFYNIIIIIIFMVGQGYKYIRKGENSREREED